MSNKPTSRTDKEQWVEEAVFGLGHHYKTTISDGKTRVEGRGNTPEKAQKVASTKWGERRQ